MKKFFSLFFFSGKNGSQMTTRMRKKGDNKNKKKTDVVDFGWRSGRN